MGVGAHGVYVQVVLVVFSVLGWEPGMLSCSWVQACLASYVVNEVVHHEDNTGVDVIFKANGADAY